MRAFLCALLLALPFSCVSAADSNRIIALEQDVRTLERLVGNLEREVRELRRGTTSPAAKLTSSATSSDQGSSDWVSASKWKRVQLGMSELEVIEILGQPTAMRAEEDSRLLLYAMEIGASGFLSGSVRLEDRKVVDVQVPALK
jgi:hypothetical protein